MTMKQLFYIFVVLFSYSVKAETKFIHKDTLLFLNALHYVESSSKYGEIIGDNGKSRGPFQIWESYYKDAVEKSQGELNKDYKNVSDVGYARRVVLWYFYRYESEALKNGEWEKLAKLHNLGPNWRKKQYLGEKHWLKVKKHLDENR